MKYLRCYVTVLIFSFSLISVFSSECDPEPPTISVTCTPDDNNTGWAYALVSGGVPPYDITPTVSGGVILTDLEHTVEVFGMQPMIVTFTITDSCGGTAIGSCTIYPGSLTFFKRGDGDRSRELTVRDYLTLLEDIKEDDILIAFEGISLFHGRSTLDLATLRVKGIKDQEGRVTILVDTEDENKSER